MNFNKNPITDASGRFRFIAPPGKAKVSLGNIPPEYLNIGEVFETVDVRGGDRKTVTFTLTRGLTAEGTIVAEDGKPLVGIPVQVIGADLEDYTSWSASATKDMPKSAADGKWRVPGLEKNAKDFRIAVGPKWEVLTPRQFTLPAENSKPIVVTLKRRAVLTLSGRVVSTTGEALTGAHIGVYARTESTNGAQPSQRNESLQTGPGGTYSLPNIRPDEKVSLNAAMTGYKYLSGGVPARSATGLSASDIVMVRLSGRVTGQVVRPGAAGKTVPAAGAYVWSLDGDHTAFTTTDPGGNFVLTNIPEGSVQLMTAAGRSTASLTANTAAPGTVRVALPAATKPAAATAPGTPEAKQALRRAMLTTMAEEIKGSPGADRSQVVELLAQEDPEAALAVARKSHSDGRVPDGVLATII